jgi:hypothetical protein
VRPRLLFASLALAACSHDATPISINVTTGQETDAFTADPAVAQVTVHVTSLDGSVDVTSDPTPPGGTFDLGEVTSDQQVSVEVTGVTADNKTVLKGFSLSGILLSSVNDIVPVFAQRVNQWARPPGGLSQTHVGGCAAVMAERYLLLTGGATASKDVSTATPGSVDAYDLLTLGGATLTPLPVAPTTMVSTGTSVLLIGATDSAWVDFQEGTSAAPDLPAGLAAFGDLAGGRLIPGSIDSGRVFVVGATRVDRPTKAVLAVDLDGTLTAFPLTIPRQGAAAVFIEKVGLVVAGGSAEAPGVELLADGGTGFVGLDFPADPVQGAGAATSGASGVALIGGNNGLGAAPTRILNPGCVSSCAVEERDGAALPATLGNVAAFTIPGGQAIVVGDEIGGGLTRTFLVDFTSAPIELPLREPRQGATVIPAPNGTLALLGGQHPDGSPAVSVELFLPVFP